MINNHTEECFIFFGKLLFHVFVLIFLWGIDQQLFEIKQFIKTEFTYAHTQKTTAKGN